MTLTATPAAQAAAPAAVPAAAPAAVPAAGSAAMPAAGPAGPRVLEVLVGRLHAEFGGDRQEIARLAAEVLETFATARVQAYVPILVEKRLRATYRVLRRPPR
ncbi:MULTISPECIES: three-helix bundle dimerization domain-containing protein [unclassified Blastococcus]